MSTIIGRKAEAAELNRAISSKEAELVAVYGRRRVGKTYLIRQTFSNRIVFEFTGAHQVSLQEQLSRFAKALTRASGAELPIALPKSWGDAFELLRDYLEPRLKGGGKKIVFLDEFPWLSTPRSKFLQAFDYFWNSWATAQPGLVVVICGSAASWMINHVVKNKGGLHNRITKRIRLLPFTLRETKSFLRSMQVQLEHYQILQLYMALGGIPHYLKEVQPGESAIQAVDRLCFDEHGILRDEFKNLYPALFDNAERHIAVVRALAGRNAGLQRGELIAQLGLSSGGTLTKVLEELAESGFISSYLPFNRQAKDTIYRLTDEYSRFYLKFIDNRRTVKAGTWAQLALSPSWMSWSGVAFEGLCLKHVADIKAALGIPAVYTEESPWRFLPADRGQAGVQIDLLIDRNDQCINVCEMKFSTGQFSIDKKYAEALRQKVSLFRQYSGTRKSVFLTAITTFGVADNIHKTGLIQNEVTMDAFF